MMDRFWAKVHKTETCWIWTANKDHHGYGRFWVTELGKKVGAHRLSYEMAFGEIQSGLDVCHRCDTPACVNPEHLFLGTAKDNVRDAMLKGRLVHSSFDYENGEDRYNSKLKDGDIRLITDLATHKSQRAIARIVGVHQSTVWKVLHNVAWKHVSREVACQ